MDGARPGQESAGGRTDHKMRDARGEDEEGVEREREDEHVERGVVASAHAVPYPRAVVVEPIYAQATQRTVGMAEAELEALTSSRLSYWASNKQRGWQNVTFTVVQNNEIFSLMYLSY